MSALNEIMRPVAAEMSQFEGYFRDVMKSKVPLLGIITNYILRRRGKQVRPLFVFLSARLCGQTGKAAFNAASFIELLHTASLIHDDVVDESFERRGFFSINALWHSKVAVLVGDFLLAKGLLLAVDQNEFQMLRIVSQAVKDMSEGELLQTEKARGLNLSEEIYFEIIRKKTASLIASCAACGALAAGASVQTIETMRQFGEYVGIAFQIRDDIFDYQDKGLIGKPTGNDLKEQKLTLPFIYVFAGATLSQKRWMLNTVKNHNRKRNRVQELMLFIVQHGGIEYARRRMDDYRTKALEVLSTFEPCPARESLSMLVDYVISRKS